MRFEFERKIGILGNMIKIAGQKVATLGSLESAESQAKNLEILLIAGHFPSCDCCRDIVMKTEKEIYDILKKKNPELKIIFLKWKEDCA